MTGDSTFALEEGSVQIQTKPSDPTLGRIIALGVGEQVTVHADGSANEIQALELRDIAKRKDCFEDRYLHAISMALARIDREHAMTPVIVGANIPGGGDLPSAPGVSVQPLEPPGGMGQPFDPLLDDPCGIGPFCSGNLSFPDPDPHDPPACTDQDNGSQSSGP